MTLQLLPNIWLECLNLDYCRYPSHEDSVIEFDFCKGEHLIILNCKNYLASKFPRIGDLSDFDTVNEYNKGKNCSPSSKVSSLNHSVKLGPGKKTAIIVGPETPGRTW